MARLSFSERVASYHARKRARGLRNVKLGLFKTHEFAPNTTGIDISDSFGTDSDRRRMITFTFGLTRTGASPSGNIISFGPATRRLLVVPVLPSDLLVQAGGTGDDQASQTISNIFPVTGQRFEVAIGIIPETGQVTVWRDGQLFDSFSSVNGTFNGPWADDSATAVYGNGVADLTVGPLSAFVGQFPLRRKV